MIDPMSQAELYRTLFECEKRLRESADANARLKMDLADARECHSRAEKARDNWRDAHDVQVAAYTQLTKDYHQLRVQKEAACTERDALARAIERINRAFAFPHCPKADLFRVDQIQDKLARALADEEPHTCRCKLCNATGFAADANSHGYGKCVERRKRPVERRKTFPSSTDEVLHRIGRRRNAGERRVRKA